MKNTVRNCIVTLVAATSLIATAHADDDHAKSEAIAKSLGFISLEQATEKALAANRAWWSRRNSTIEISARAGITSSRSSMPTAASGT